VTPGLARRLGGLLYEALTFLAIAFFAGWVFFFASGGRDATAGPVRLYLQIFIAVVWSAYLLVSWLRGGQTLAMRAWRIRLVELTPARALARLALAALFLPTGISLVWALFDRDRQFLHDRLARTRLVLRATPDAAGARARS
jgi:uncharacterized RDD family membrane protein YckC